MGDLNGRVALVSGGARGLGAATARALAAEGAKVVVTDVRDAGEVADGIGGAFVRHDVTSEDSWIAAIAFAKERFGGLDILVNNAGVCWTTPIVSQDLEAFRRMQQVNVEGVLLGMKHAIPAIAERARQWDGGGAIVNVSSVAGLVGVPMHGAYSASKGAVRLMTKTAALECARMKVRVNSVHPGVIDTPLAQEGVDAMVAASGESAEAIRARIARGHPLGRLGRDVDVAHAVVFLASDKAAFITGSELVVDGGMTAM